MKQNTWIETLHESIYVHVLYISASVNLSFLFAYMYLCVCDYVHTRGCIHAYLCVSAGGSMCLLEINLMVGNSISPCCWIHLAEIHQLSRGHLHSSSEGTFFTAQTKGRRNMPALWTHFRGSHLCRRGAANGESRKMTKLTKTVKVKADPCEIMHVIYS